MPPPADPFTVLRDVLDADHDRRDRLVQATRNITRLSKRVIFELHRSDATRAISNAAAVPAQLRAIQDAFAALRADLAGPHFWRHHRTLSAALQEYTEALAFAHYLAHGTLLPYAAAQCALSDEDGVPYFPLPAADFVLGLCDLTGELMRVALAAISRPGGRARAVAICAFVRACKADFERFAALPGVARDLRAKQRTTARSLQKIEDAVYAITVRTAEYDLPPDMLDDIVRRYVSGVNVNVDDSGRGRGRGRDDDDADEGEGVDGGARDDREYG